MPKANCIFKKGTRITFANKKHFTIVTYSSKGNSANEYFPNDEHKLDFLSFVIPDEDVALGIASFLANSHGLGANCSKPDYGWRELSNGNKIFSFILV